MPLPEPRLDDLRFQRDLVDEARLRIIRYCPEWTDYNLSDPGITLIELFAWMTELITYRLNRVPEKNYIKFLDLLGVQLQPPSSARAELTFWLSVPFPIRPDDDTFAVVPKGTLVATPYFEEEEEIIFTTDERLEIHPPHLIQLRREGDFNKNYLPRLELRAFDPFQNPPQVNDTFYLGFDPEQDLSGSILQLTFRCLEDRGTGIERRNPPLVWEYSTNPTPKNPSNWQEVKPSTRPREEDTTGGLNNPNGNIVFYLPLTAKPTEVHGKLAYWLRCRFEPREEQRLYTQSPRIQGIEAYARGGTVWATHAIIYDDELLGRSNGEPGQIFHLQNVPVLTPSEDETVEVEELRDGELVFVPWQRVSDFSISTRYDRHFTLDLATGEVCFGPGIHQRNGTVRQYGRIPEVGRMIRFNRYRHGGGAQGNVPAGKLQILRTSLSYITRVTNLEAAEGGFNQESLEEAKMRARREIRAQQRAVTIEDFEHLAKRASRAVARVKCHTPTTVRPGDDQTSDLYLPPGMIELLIVPSAFKSVRAGDYSGLQLSSPLQAEIRAYMDQYRLLTTTLHIRAPRYLGVKVHAAVVPTDYTPVEQLQVRVLEALRRFISPLALPPEDQVEGVETAMNPIDTFLRPDWEGWPFGRDLYVSELFSLIQTVRGVKHVLNVTLSYRELPLSSASGQSTLEPVLTPLEGRMIAVPEDTLLGSLNHDVEVVYV